MDRPTSVTVIGWIWAVLGGLMALSGTMALAMSGLILVLARNEPKVPAFLSFFPLIALVQVCAAGFIVWNAVRLLRLKSSARLILEVATWLMLLWIVGFGIFWIFSWLNLSAQANEAPIEFKVIGAFMGGLVMLAFCVAFGLLLRGLRSKPVRKALRSE